MEVIAWTGCRTAKVHEMLRGDGVAAAEQAGCNRVQKNPARAEGFLKIDYSRRAKERAAYARRPTLPPNTARGQLGSELITAKGETRCSVETQRESDLMKRRGGNRRLDLSVRRLGIDCG